MKKPILYTGSPVTLFDFVGILQEGMKGHHFHALSFRLVPGGVEVTPDNYDPELAHMSRVEHYLQDARDSFPGTSFQSLVIEYNGAGVIIRKID